MNEAAEAYAMQTLRPAPLQLQVEGTRLLRWMRICSEASLMNVLELFSGTASLSKVARARGHVCFTVDNDGSFGPDLCMDVLCLDMLDIPFEPDVIWASPPCNCFSQSAIYRYWRKNPDGTYCPRNEKAAAAVRLFERTEEIVRRYPYAYYFIENPCSSLRKRDFMQRYPTRRTVTYCQYGDDRQKRTDIWTNCDAWVPRPQCKNKAPCHQRAPRGSRTGTQGLKGAVARAVVPPALCEEILEVCERLLSA